MCRAEYIWGDVREGDKEALKVDFFFQSAACGDYGAYVTYAGILIPSVSRTILEETNIHSFDPVELQLVMWWTYWI